MAMRVPALSFLALLVVSGGAEAWRYGHSAGKPVVQPIAFDHKKHVEENQLACSTCHEYFEKETFSGLPGAEICASCHLEPQGKSAEEAKLVQLLQGGEPLEWKPLFRQPPHVFFTHRRHVVVAHLECAVCHGSIAASLVPPGRVQRLHMRDCLECHRRAGATTACTGCHR